VREVAEDIAVVETSHGNFRKNHLQERGKGGENTKLVSGESKPGGSGEVAPLHYTRGDEDLWVFLMDHFQTCGTFKIG
jgi:hypothetical protein